jgi:hypothetical protein
MVFTNWLLSITVSSSKDKIVFVYMNGCKNKEFAEDNAAMAWESLKNNFEPTSLSFY